MLFIVGAKVNISFDRMMENIDKSKSPINSITDCNCVVRLDVGLHCTRTIRWGKTEYEWNQSEEENGKMCCRHVLWRFYDVDAKQRWFKLAAVTNQHLEHSISTRVTNGSKRNVRNNCNNNCNILMLTKKAYLKSKIAFSRSFFSTFSRHPENSRQNSEKVSGENNACPFLSVDDFHATINSSLTMLLSLFL